MSEPTAMSEDAHVDPMAKGCVKTLEGDGAVVSHEEGGDAAKEETHTTPESRDEGANDLGTGPEPLPLPHPLADGDMCDDSKGVDAGSGANAAKEVHGVSESGVGEGEWSEGGEGGGGAVKTTNGKEAKATDGEGADEKEADVRGDSDALKSAADTSRSKPNTTEHHPTQQSSGGALNGFLRELEVWGGEWGGRLNKLEESTNNTIHQFDQMQMQLDLTLQSTQRRVQEVMDLLASLGAPANRTTKQNAAPKPSPTTTNQVKMPSGGPPPLSPELQSLLASLTPTNGSSTTNMMTLAPYVPPRVVVMPPPPPFSPPSLSPIPKHPQQPPPPHMRHATATASGSAPPTDWNPIGNALSSVQQAHPHPQTQAAKPIVQPQTQNPSLSAMSQLTGASGIARASASSTAPGSQSGTSDGLVASLVDTLVGILSSSPTKDASQAGKAAAATKPTVPQSISPSSYGSGPSGAVHNGAAEGRQAVGGGGGGDGQKGGGDESPVRMSSDIMRFLESFADFLQSDKNNNQEQEGPTGVSPVSAPTSAPSMASLSSSPPRSSPLTAGIPGRPTMPPMAVPRASPQLPSIQQQIPESILRHATTNSSSSSGNVNGASSRASGPGGSQSGSGGQGATTSTTEQLMELLQTLLSDPSLSKPSSAPPQPPPDMQPPPVGNKAPTFAEQSHRSQPLDLPPLASLLPDLDDFDDSSPPANSSLATMTDTSNGNVTEGRSEEERNTSVVTALDYGAIFSPGGLFYHNAAPSASVTGSAAGSAGWDDTPTAAQGKGRPTGGDWSGKAGKAPGSSGGGPSVPPGFEEISLEAIQAQGAKREAGVIGSGRMSEKLSSQGEGEREREGTSNSHQGSHDASPRNHSETEGDNEDEDTETPLWALPSTDASPPRPRSILGRPPRAPPPISFSAALSQPALANSLLFDDTFDWPPRENGLASDFMQDDAGGFDGQSSPYGDEADMMSPSPFQGYNGYHHGYADNGMADPYASHHQGGYFGMGVPEWQDGGGVGHPHHPGHAGWQPYGPSTGHGEWGEEGPWHEYGMQCGQFGYPQQPYHHPGGGGGVQEGGMGPQHHHTHGRGTVYY
ncbi:unnamed protein product [Vitrella brassicaformis CCMP3155]|uniref:Uncharacterized protein n=1 Tax=Vitrella brassicaformis (strain CCMP3155) TaxID=1169540 RepID=A0A0G4GKT2_VITBC|nr:unnamed protein product [Vitrella brassicaformis CCMP3155]|eukprot:CEM30625.1 unnamed protein product [Vitrella brassicaformis CCMP3155]